MKRYLLLIVCCCGLLHLCAQEKEKVAWKLRLDPAEVTATRKFRDIGTTRTEVDTVVLRESVANSIADILSQNTSIFIKNYGRGTLATASFRGTSPSHTQVLWNGMRINSPMLGQVDFSLIPSYFVDEMSLWHGGSSVNVTGGGLGGAITLNTRPVVQEGYNLHFVQGISSFNTYDEYLRFTYAAKKWQSTTRLSYVNSENDFKYRNILKANIGADGSYSKDIPVEKNKNSAYRDFHWLQEFYYDRGDGNKFSVAGWFTDTKRGIPMLMTDQNEENEAKNQQKETSLRLVGNWEHYREKWKMEGKAGYNFDRIFYTYDVLLAYDRPAGREEMATMIDSRSRVHTAFTQGDIQYFRSEKLMLSGNLTANYHYVSSKDEVNRVGYEKGRAEASALATARYRPWQRLGFALDVREEYYGKFTPVIPAAFLDVLLWPEAGMIFKASVARNYRYPTLNDMYFLPGGNDSLRSEKGFTYDGGIEFMIRSGKVFSLKAEVSAYNSRIDDWILWLPANKGYWTPRNVKKVHSYGWEVKGNAMLGLGEWTLWMDALWSQTRSINHGIPVSPADESIGKQLVYIPEFSSSVMGKLGWKGFALIYKYNYFGQRYTTSDNNPGKIGKLTPFYMNDLSVEKNLSVHRTGISLKFTIYNLFNEEYVSVLGHPMARRNYGFFVGINPRWNNH